jgi:hypothetical protein
MRSAARVAASFDSMRRSIVFPLVLLFALLIAMVSAVRSEGSFISLAAGQGLSSQSPGE